MNFNDISYGITGFIDILGFSNTIATASTFEEIRNAKTKIDIVQSFFEHKPENTNTKEVHKIYKKKVIAISDSIILYLPLKSEATRYSGTLDPFLAQISTLANSQALCVFNNVFVRGGLDIGWWYSKKSALMSNALVNAVRRESTAVVPVIALCDEIYNYLSTHPDRSTYHPSIDPISGLFREYNVGEVRFFFLDYIGICSQEADNTESWLAEHARIIEQAASAASTNHVLSKYQWLAEYHNEIARELTSDAQCLCNV